MNKRQKNVKLLKQWLEKKSNAKKTKGWKTQK